MDAALKLAYEVAERLKNIDGIVAVSLGGSQARMSHDKASDIDLGLYYDANHPPSVNALNKLAEELDERHLSKFVTDFGDRDRGWMEAPG